MAKLEDDILGIQGRIGQMTAYTRNGKKYLRVAHTHQPRRLSRKQLMVRERQSHNNALWRALKETNQVYIESGDNTTYNRFMSLNTASPVPYLGKLQYHSGNALLLPNMLLSDGPLKPIGYQFDEVDGQLALFTDLTRREVRSDYILLFVLRQKVITHQDWHDQFYLNIEVEPLTPDDFTTVPSTLLTPYQNKDGCLVLVGERYADPMMGFGLVRVKDGHASHQRVVTNCTYYERYTTEEALQAAADSYGGLTEAPYLFPE
jgi:hypothetical protein